METPLQPAEVPRTRSVDGPAALKSPTGLDGVQFLVLCTGMLWLLWPQPALAQAIEQRIDRIEEQVETLQEGQRKDFWDKVDASGTLIGGVLVAFIGALATGSYNRRQRRLESQHKSTEYEISRLRAVGEILPHLAAEDERIVEVAIVAIAELGNPELASTIATTYQRHGGIGALSRLSTSSNATVSKVAGISLEAIGNKLHESAVRILVGREGRVAATGTGFALGSSGLIVTASSVVVEGCGEAFAGGIEAEPIPLETVYVEGSDVGLAVFRSRSPLPPLIVGSASDLHLGDPVQTLFYGKGGKRALVSGSAGGLLGDRLHVTGMSTERGAAGAPLVDGSGRVVGMHVAFDPLTNVATALTAERLLRTWDETPELRTHPLS